MKHPLHVLALSGLLLTACSTQTEEIVGTAPVVTDEPSSPTEPTPPDVDLSNPNGPWNGGIYMATSTDGVSFAGRDLVVDRAGVPNLLLRENGDLILTYQYFSETDGTMFDVIAYSVSEDDGATWTEPLAVELEGVPASAEGDKKPMDPTLVETEDGALRLYFTYHGKNDKTANLYSATAEDGDISSTFVVNQTPALSVGENLLDPSVVYFDGLWHHYSWQDRSDDNYHTVSEDGLTFTREDDITLPMDFLGQVIPFENGLMFYGTGPKGVVYAYSEDGYDWEMGEKELVLGADPGVAELATGSYVMIFTSRNFND